MKFAIRIDWIWRPLLLIGGATPANSYVEVDGDEIHLRFGLMFNERILKANIAAASGRPWPWWRGIGLRAAGEVCGLIGSREGVVELRLRERARVRIGFIPWPFGIGRIAVSLEDPQACIDAISGGTAAASPSHAPAAPDVPSPARSTPAAASRPAASFTSSAIPRTMAELTPAWLTAALRERGVIGAQTSVTQAWSESIGAGAGFLGQLARVHLRYDGEAAGAPATLIAKMPTLDPGGRAVCRIFQFYEREIRFYEQIASGVSQLRVPRAYYTAMDIDADDYLILLEDVCDARMGDEVAGCTAEEAERVVRSIAAFHAAWWESPQLDQVDWMPYINAPVHQSAEGSYNQAWEPFLEMFGEKLTPAMREIASNMRAHVIDLLNSLEAPPRTIVHGDYRLDNVFFCAAGAPQTVATIDWQISSRGRGIFDVAYFLSSCVDPEIRRAEERRLVRLWHEIATAGHEGYSFYDAWTDYRRAVLYCNVYTVIGIGTLDAANERGMALFNAWLTRRCAAIEDLNAGELMPG